MKLPGKVRSIVDEMEDLNPNDKAKLVKHLNDIVDSLPEHPTPQEAKRIVNGALKKLKIVVGSSDDVGKPAKEKEEKKEEKPAEEKKEKVKESKMTFKSFLLAEMVQD